MTHRLDTSLFALRPVVESHEGSRHTRTIAADDSKQWSVKWGLTQRRAGLWRGIISLALKEGAALSTTAGLRFEFREWSREVYVLLPGAVYAANRFPTFSTNYPPIAPLHAASNPDRLPRQSEVPRLRYEPGPSVLRQMSSDPAFPGIGFFFPAQGRGLWILTPQKNTHGLFGYELEENESRDAATLTIFSPGFRREYAYEICKDTAPSPDRAPDLPSGAVIEFPLWLEEFPCDAVTGLFEKLLDVRRAITPQPAVRHDIPFSEVWRILEDKYDRENWVEPWGYFSVGVEPMRSRHFTQNWQMGWVGGMISPHAFALRGNAEMRERALRNFDFVFPRSQAPSGYFYGCGDGERFYSDHFHRSSEPLHLVRKSADGLFYMLGILETLDRRGEAKRIKSDWLAGLRRCADAFVKTWESEGQFGHFVDHNTGNILIANSVSGGIAPAALLKAADRFSDRAQAYRRVAEAAARHFVTDYLQKGYTTGGPGDAAQCADSESAAGLLESLVGLAERNPDGDWWAAARLAALHLASWTVSYDYEFPETSTFGKLGMLANGTVLANAQNKHSAPGICTHSGRSLFRLFRRLGESWMMDLLRDIAHTLPQYLSRADRPILCRIPYNRPEGAGELYLKPGWMCERVNLTRWGHNELIGEVFYYSCWSEVSLLLTIAELPGVYAQPDTRRVWSLDHVDARWESAGLLLTNPTPFPAEVRVCMETSDAARSTPAPNAEDFTVATLAPGGRQLIR